MRPFLMAFLLLAASPACADPTVFKFDVPGAVETRGSAISPSGIVAGTYRPHSAIDPCGQECGFIRTPDGTITTFGVFKASSLTVSGINDDGTVAGSYVNDRHFRGFVRTPDGVVTHVASHAGYNDVEDINESGTAVGFATHKGHDQAFAWTPDRGLTPFDDRRCQDIDAVGVNDSGTITGNCKTDGGYIGYLRAPDGGLTLFTAPGMRSVFVVGIDDSGAVVGYGGKGSFIRDSDGTFQSFAIPRDFITFVSAGMGTVNGDRQVVGHINGRYRRSLGFIQHQDGSAETFDVTDGIARRSGTYVAGIAATGAITGSYSEDGDTVHGYIRLP